MTTLKRCYWWPDYKPTEDIREFRKHYKLTYIQPVYRYWYDWFYLAECDCGNETIVKPYGAQMCTQCLRQAKTDDWKPQSFDRSKHCRQGMYQCKHYIECLDYRLANPGEVSPRFKDDCYEMTDDEAKVLIETPDAQFPMYRTPQ